MNDLLSQLRPQGALHHFAEQVLASWSVSDAKPMLEKVMSFSGIALKGLVEFLIIMVTAIYFLVDGERVYRWALAFLPPGQRRKVGLAAGEISEVISAYMGGQLITSLLCSVFVFTVLMLFGVPNAALLAVLAGVFDILPLIGFFLSVIPAVAAACLVSPSTALMVGLLYLAYHLFENYFIVPKIYGKKLRLSSLTVLVFCMVAAVVGGVLGVIMILPIVASYPIIERIWLRRHLEPDTVAKHDAIEVEEAD